MACQKSLLDAGSDRLVSMKAGKAAGLVSIARSIRLTVADRH